MRGQVKLILREDVPKLGQAGDLVSVKPGFARNFLIPQRKALIATESRVKELEHHRRAISEKVEQERKLLDGQKGQLERMMLEMVVQAGEEGKLFGSVTNVQVTELLDQHGFKIDRRKVQVSQPIREVGDHEIGVHLGADVIAKVKLKVIAAE